ncbi:uncharacterized protein DSM5745_10289 [Aspergillus mulundensis]|uniref:Uncharacterized protein n=1 Tax=Aspergillus mulundensis TaxID=1810919 RepID=A0A3D8QNB9_9EURO|nr:hypothetical protein DSM5745_10289 [Aspergillus mulundensis]RDW63178.1 hypothetical protein DSM5745_10289 [Aspergillus mulundensis]
MARPANLALYYHSSSSQSDASKIEAELKQSGKVVTCQGDLTSAVAVIKLFEDVKRRLGKALKKPITEITEEYDTIFAVNSKAAFFVLKPAAKHVSDDGKIIIIATALPLPDTTPHTLVAKHRLSTYLRCLQGTPVPPRQRQQHRPCPMDNRGFKAVKFLKANAVGG